MEPQSFYLENYHALLKDNDGLKIKLKIRLSKRSCIKSRSVVMLLLDMSLV